VQAGAWRSVGAELRAVGASGDVSLYMHVPFCFHKCHYCDFYSIVDRQDRQEAFAARLIEELRGLSGFAGGPLRTIFVGGGTPTLLRVELWERVLRVLRSEFDVGAVREFTVECNPETASGELFGVLRAGGVDRVSMGAQSFNPSHLKTLERWHDPESVPRAVGLARGAGIGRVSLDLIYAVPGQTLEDLDRDLEEVLALGFEHASCYALTYEPKTAMTARLERGEFARADEDLEADMFERVLERMRRAGLERYEVSNFARPGAECEHNLRYWRGRDWLAAGPSASGHVKGLRWKNVPRLDDYLACSDGGLAPVIDVEPPEPRRSLAERVMTGLRLREGLGWAEMRERAAGLDGATADRVERVAARWCQRGVVDADALEAGRLVLSDAGFLVADGLAGELMAAVVG
jgi:oxygen-independent coproporphyrinogen-3 oxidase